MKISGSNEKIKPRFKKRSLMQDWPSAPKVNVKGGNGCQGGEPTCVTCGKKNCGKYIAGNGGFYGCCKDGNKVCDCPTIVARVREAKQVPPSVPEGDVPRNINSMLSGKEGQSRMMMTFVSVAFLSCVVMGFLYVGDNGE